MKGQIKTYWPCVVFNMCVGLLCALMYANANAKAYLVPVKWSGPATLIYRVNTDDAGSRECITNGSGEPTCGIQSDLVVYVHTKHGKQKAIRGGPNFACNSGTVAECFYGQTMTIMYDGLEEVTGIEGGWYRLGWSLSSLQSLPATVPPRPTSCAVEANAIKLAAMVPGQTDTTVVPDNVRVRCDASAGLRVTLLTKSITYTPGAVSFIAVTENLHVDAGITTAVPLTITTRVGSDVVAGTYTQAIVLKLEHD